MPHREPADRPRRGARAEIDPQGRLVLRGEEEFEELSTDPVCLSVWSPDEAEPSTSDRLVWGEAVAARNRTLAEFFAEQRPAAAGHGIHHLALRCRVISATAAWYHGVAGLHVTTLHEGPAAAAGSVHLLVAVGAEQYLVFSDFPGLGHEQTAAPDDGLERVAIEVSDEHWRAIRARLDEERWEYVVSGEASLRTSDPDGTRIDFVRRTLRDAAAQ